MIDGLIDRWLDRRDPPTPAPGPARFTDPATGRVDAVALAAELERLERRIVELSAPPTGGARHGAATVALVGATVLGMRACTPDSGPRLGRVGDVVAAQTASAAPSPAPAPRVVARRVEVATVVVGDTVYPLSDMTADLVNGSAVVWPGPQPGDRGRAIVLIPGVVDLAGGDVAVIGGRRWETVRTMSQPAADFAGLFVQSDRPEVVLVEAVDAPTRTVAVLR